MSQLRALIPERARKGKNAAGPALDVHTPIRAVNDRSPAAAGDPAVVAEAAAHAKVGRLGRALALVQERLLEYPSDPELVYARALTLLDWGRLPEALADLRAAEAQGLSSFGLHINLAQALYALGIADEAERRARQAISLNDSHPIGHACLGAVLQGTRRLDEAIRCYERAYELAPDRVDLLWHMIACRLDQDDAPAGESTARHAISVHGGDHPKSWSLLGSALSLQQRWGEAMAAFERAEAIEARTGQRAEAFVMHGFQLLWCGRLEEAADLYARYLPGSTDPGAHAHYGMILLTAGHLREGWPLYEFRWCYDRLLATRPRFARPEWRGQEVLGKVLLLWAEQGVGDTVQFVRFARLLKARGASVVLHVPERLKEFAKGFPDVDRVVSDRSELVDGFDYHISTMSLPGVLGIDLASIPADVPYLTIDAERGRRWREKLASVGPLKVGLAWAGNPKHERDRFRSVPLSRLAPLFGIDGVELYSLQKERRADDAGALPPGAKLIDLGPELDDFRDTAAAIDALDLVIAADTAVAHVAGAIAKPVWMMLPSVSDFRWLTDREDSPWYPSMRLFRQRQVGDWDDVVTRVETGLRNAVREHESGDTSSGLLRSATSAVKPALPLDGVVPRLTTSQLCGVTDSRHGIVEYTRRIQTLARSLEWYGEWLQPQLDLLAKLLSAGATVIEAGCGIGVHTLALTQIIGPTGHLFAYEADPTYARILLQNLQTNQMRNRVTVMSRNLEGLTLNARNDVAASAATDPQGDGAWRDTVDDLGLSRLDLLKVDDAGAAEKILEGAADTIWRLRPLLFIAAQDDFALNESAGRTRDFSYRCWRIETSLFNPANFNRRADDIFGGATVLSLLAIPEETGADIHLAGCIELT